MAETSPWRGRPSMEWVVGLREWESAVRVGCQGSGLVVEQVGGMRRVGRK